jgi:large repetitive protein
VSAGSLPPGLSLRADGTLSGTPSTAGSCTFTARVTSTGLSRSATKDFTLVVGSPLAATAPAAKASEVGVPFTLTPSATGGAAPLAWSVAGGSLPPGLRVDAGTGAVSGAPTSAGSFSATLAVSDAVASRAWVDVKVTVAARLALARTPLPRATVGELYEATAATGRGVGPVRWRIVEGKLPTGIRLDRRRARSRAPPGGRTARITVRATDLLGATATRVIVLRVGR